MELRGNVVVGVDAGATKTEAISIDLASGMCYMAFGEAANPSAVGIEKASRVVASTARESLKGLGRESAVPALVAVAMAGIVNEESAEYVRTYLARELGCPESTIYVFEDLVAAHASVFLLEDGIVGILGTGSSVYGYAQGRAVRVGGWGHLLGDEGSAFRLGMRCLREVLECLDGLRECSRLAEFAKHSLNFKSTADVLSRVYRSENPKAVVASLAELVMEAYGGGDSTAVRIVEEEIGAFAYQVAAVARELGITAVRVGFVGSLYLRNRDVLRGLLKKKIEEYLGRRVELIEQKLRPCCGSVLAALRKSDTGDEHLLEILRRCCRLET